MNQIAKTILEQLGGNKFVVITGAHTFVACQNWLRFRLRRNAKRVTWVQITLMPSDTYTVKFVRWQRKTGAIILSEHEGVYADGLIDLFEKNTGLYARL